MTVTEYNLCVEKYADGIYRFVLKNLKDTDRTKDIVQDSFEKLWIRYSEISFEKAKSYLFKTAYHTMIDYTRKDKSIEHYDQLPERATFNETTYSDLKEVLHRIVGQLPPIQRSVLLLRDYEGYSYEEIGQITNLSESQVKVYIYRARKYMMKQIRTIETLI